MLLLSYNVQQRGSEYARDYFSNCLGLRTPYVAADSESSCDGQATMKPHLALVEVDRAGGRRPRATPFEVCHRPDLR